jgi:hypothetical protein
VTVEDIQRGLAGQREVKRVKFLTHLAADVFSHNHYVPTQLIVSYPANALRHVYWEARFDTMQDVKYRELISLVRHRELH